MSNHDTEAEFLYHEPCPKCGSSDANAVYDDGHTWCFSCESIGRVDGEEVEQKKTRKKGRAVNLLQGEVRGIRSRKLTDETCKKFNYQIARHQGRTVQVAPYYDADGNMVAQKVRTADKEFYWLGNNKKALPFGAQAWPRTGRKIIVTEGEIDAMAMSQAQGNKWPVVSIACGAGKTGAKVRKYIAQHREYFEGFDEVVLMFDMDDPGRVSSNAAAEVLGNRALIATLPAKDPAELLKQGRVDELIKAMWGAKKYRPQGLVSLSSLKEKIKQRPQEGISWCFPELTRVTYGKRLGELVALGAGTGVGKTDFMTQDMLHMILEHGQKIGVFALEQQPAETGLRLAGKAAQVPLHIPDYYNEALLDAAWERLGITDANEKVWLFDHFGAMEWEAIRSKIEYLYHAEGVQYFYLDHLTALAAAEEDERKGLERIMADMGGLVKQIPIHITFVSHLATPDGKPHEEGGRVMIRHFKGSRAIGYWSHFMFGLERDQQNENEAVRTTTTFRILKDRYTGRSTGHVFYLGYDPETGMLYETDKPEEASDYGFSSEKLDTDTEGTNDF